MATLLIIGEFLAGLALLFTIGELIGKLFRLDHFGM